MRTVVVGLISDAIRFASFSFGEIRKFDQAL